MRLAVRHDDAPAFGQIRVATSSGQDVLQRVSETQSVGAAMASVSVIVSVIDDDPSFVGLHCSQAPSPGALDAHSRNYCDRCAAFFAAADSFHKSLGRAGLWIPRGCSVDLRPLFLRRNVVLGDSHFIFHPSLLTRGQPWVNSVDAHVTF